MSRSSRSPLAVLCLALVLPVRAIADEGQWPPDQLASFDSKAWDALKKRGLALSPAEIWNGSGGGLATAAIQIGGCSAAFVSAEGLIATNHHCAFDAIQLASTPERNYLRDGFVARSRSEEVPARGGASRALVLRRIVDVTDRVRGPKTPFARAKTDPDRYEAVELARKEIVAECEKTPGSRCQVASFYDGLAFKLQEQTELKDVRLVYAPPQAVGEYGGEVDNFRWPRHTGDFSILRAYAAPDGSPAAYSPSNVAYRPAAYLRVSDRGVEPGDLVMVMGYPGRTQRFLPASGVKNMAEWVYPTRSKVYTELIALLTEAGKADAATALKVSSTLKSYANSETNARGQIDGLRRNGASEARAREEAALAAHLRGKSDGAAVVAAVEELERIQAAERADQGRRFFLDEIERAPGYLNGALKAVRWAEERAKPDMARDAGYQDRDLDRAVQREKDAVKSLAPAAYRKVLAALVAQAMAAARIATLQDAFSSAKPEDIEAKLAAMDAKTRLGQEETRVANLKATTEALRASDDPYIQLALALAPDLAEIRRKRKEASGALLRLRPVTLGALKAYRESGGGSLYPDANSTLRVSIAEVKGYVPREATSHTPATTTRGLLEKETGETPFATPAKVLEVLKRGELGRWGSAATGVPVCFLSNADTTGGNSGSPVVNGKGELVGLNFDRVWENVAGDFGWNPERSRNVTVDIRYALFLIDRVDSAPALVQELLGAK